MLTYSTYRNHFPAMVVLSLMKAVARTPARYGIPIGGLNHRRSSVGRLGQQRDHARQSAYSTQNTGGDRPNRLASPGSAFALSHGDA